MPPERPHQFRLVFEDPSQQPPRQRARTHINPLINDSSVPMILPMVPPTTPQPIPPIIQQQVLDLDGGDTATNSQATAASEAATAATTRSNMRWTAAEEEILINAVKGKWDVLNATNGNIPIGRVWDQILRNTAKNNLLGNHVDPVTPFRLAGEKSSAITRMMFKTKSTRGMVVKMFRIDVLIMN
ncbi:hypothetical protein BX666DRAFT_2114425 [Dichotomocladium elegans]|nr:hypothetical protein BX666DRAFT_2114425 [Dichotomocladium elegans]